MKTCLFLRLNEKYALAYDPLQWIVLQRSGLDKTGPNEDSEIWRGVFFIRTHKRILLRTLREKRIAPTAEAHAVLDALPDHFDAFKVAVEAGGLEGPL